MKEDSGHIFRWDQHREVWLGYDEVDRIRYILQHQDLQQKAGYDEDWISNSQVAFEHWRSSIDNT